MNKFIILALTAALIPAAASAQQEAVHPFRTSIASGTALRLVVDVPQSNLLIQTGKAGMIEASGTVTREYKKDRDAARAQEIANAASVHIEIRGTRAYVTRAFGAAAEGRKAQNSNTRFELVVKIPQGMHVEVVQNTGAVRLDGSFGNVQVDMRAGEIGLKVPKASVRELSARATVGDVTTNLGDRTISKQGVFAGKTHYINESGHSFINLRLLAGDIDVQLVQ